MSSGRPRVAGTAHLRNIGPTPQVTPAQTRYKLWEVSNRRMRYRMADRNPSRGRRLQVAMQDSVMHYSRGINMRAPYIERPRTGGRCAAGRWEDLRPTGAKLARKRVISRSKPL
jgi:hypothetical protein